MISQPNDSQLFWPPKKKKINDDGNDDDDDNKAKQIKLIVSQAFFLGKPMRDAAFFLCANHNHN